MYLSSAGSFGLRTSCTEVRRPTFWWLCVNPGILPQMPQKGDCTQSTFFGLVACKRVSSSEGAPAGFWGVFCSKPRSRGRCHAQERRTPADVPIAVGVHKTERPGLNRQALSKIHCHNRDTSLSRRFISSVYNVLRKYTRNDNGVYLHRAGPRAMGHRRCLKGYDRASKWDSEKQRETVLGSETISLVSCHTTL